MKKSVILVCILSISFNNAKALTDSEIEAIKNCLTSSTALKIYIGAGTTIAAKAILSYLNPILEEARPKTAEEKLIDQQTRFQVDLNKYESFSEIYNNLKSNLKEEKSELQKEKRVLEDSQELSESEKHHKIEELNDEIKTNNQQRKELDDIHTQLLSRLKKYTSQSS